MKKNANATWVSQWEAESVHLNAPFSTPPPTVRGKSRWSVQSSHSWSQTHLKALICSITDMEISSLMVSSPHDVYFPQVWFQNARAKFRRNCLYQESVGVDNVSDNSTITSPSVPSPELSHESLSPSSPTGTSSSQHTHTSTTQNTTALAIHNVHSPMSSEFLYQ